MKRSCKYYLLLFPLLILFIFLISGCQKENILNRERIGTGCEYFPLKIGNIWHYSRSKAEVKNISEVNNKEYFEILVETFAADTVFYSYYEYYRQTPDGKVFMLNNETKEEFLKFDFFIPEKASWTYPESNYNQSWKVTKVSGSKILQINNRKIENCIQFDYDLLQAVDDEHTIILAPGVGRIVSQSYAWGIGDTLRSAIINGIEYKLK